MEVNIGNYSDDGQRKLKVKIDNWDTWSMAHTLALIIHPMLVQLKENTHGAPYTDDCDVPEELRSYNAKAKENEWGTDEFHFKRWDYILDKMIAVFEEISKDETKESSFYSYADPEAMQGLKVDEEGLKEYQEWLQSGTLLFGKYFRNLWD